jgi:sugar phosphate isomerase/epimerase
VRLSLSEISTLNATFAQDVAAYSAAGFAGIGVWEFKLPAEDGANRGLLSDGGLTVTNCVPEIPSILQLGIAGMEGPADPEQRIAAICASVARLAAYDPTSVVCLTGPADEGALPQARAVVVDGLQRIAQAARAAGVRVGLEPVHPAQRGTVSFINTLAEATALLDEAELDDVGIMFDTFHAWDDSDAGAWIASNMPRISGVHISDRRPEGGGEDRLLPGENGTRTRDLIGALERSGWHGTFDVEIFSSADGYWGLPVSEAARRAHAAAVALWE